MGNRVAWERKPRRAVMGATVATAVMSSATPFLNLTLEILVTRSYAFSSRYKFMIFITTAVRSHHTKAFPFCHPPRCTGCHQCGLCPVLRTRLARSNALVFNASFSLRVNDLFRFIPASRCVGFAFVHRLKGICTVSS